MNGSKMVLGTNAVSLFVLVYFGELVRQNTLNDEVPFEDMNNMTLYKVVPMYSYRRKADTAWWP